MPSIVVLDGHVLNPGDNSWAPLEALGDLTVYPRTPAELVLERAAGAEILVLNKNRLNGPLMDQLPRLRCIGMSSTGYDVVDIEAAASRGIPVINVESYAPDSVAQLALALLLELCRRPALHDAAIRDGEWSRSPDWCFWKTPQIDLAGKTLGLLGCGNIGRKVGVAGQAMGMRVIAYSRSGNTAPFELVGLDQLFAESEVLSLHCPLNDASRRIVNRDRLAAMPRGALLINTARGKLLDEEAVADALRTGQLGGLGADVVSHEPIRPDNPLLHAPGVVLTPHLAATTLTARRAIVRILGENLAAWLRGEPRSVVNAALLQKRVRAF